MHMKHNGRITIGWTANNQTTELLISGVFANLIHLHSSIICKVLDQ